MRVPYCLPPPHAAHIVWGPSPVTESVAGAESDAGQNRISKLSCYQKYFTQQHFFRQESVSFKIAESIR